jgi:4-amino-4-deoxy-L-arabinose transferase-like glycosyltransferase
VALALRSGKRRPGSKSVRAEEKANIGWLLASAILMGFALGTKLTVLAFWGMLLIGVLGWNLATTRRWAKETIPHAALWGAVSLIVGLPWYIKTWLYTGNPVYPFFYNLFGGRYWNAENAALYSGDQARFGIDKTPVSLLLGPWQVTMEPLTRNWVNSLIPPGSPEPERPFIFTEFISFSLSPICSPCLLQLRCFSGSGVCRKSRSIWCCFRSVFTSSGSF